MFIITLLRFHYYYCHYWLILMFIDNNNAFFFFDIDYCHIFHTLIISFAFHYYYYYYHRLIFSYYYYCRWYHWYGFSLLFITGFHTPLPLAFISSPLLNAHMCLVTLIIIFASEPLRHITLSLVAIIVFSYWYWPLMPLSPPLLSLHYY